MSWTSGRGVADAARVDAGEAEGLRAAGPR